MSLLHILGVCWMHVYQYKPPEFFISEISFWSQIDRDRERGRELIGFPRKNKTEAWDLSLFNLFFCFLTITDIFHHFHVPLCERERERERERELEENDNKNHNKSGDEMGKRAKEKKRKSYEWRRTCMMKKLRNFRLIIQASHDCIFTFTTLHITARGVELLFSCFCFFLFVFVLADESFYILTYPHITFLSRPLPFSLLVSIQYSRMQAS